MKKYTYKNKKYTLLFEGQMKDKNSRGWFKAVIYKQDESGLIFCRELEEFYNRFEEV